MKRVIDFIIALCAFPFVLLLCIGVWIAIKCDDGGPLFHMASRIGKNGRIFKMYKFRSMIVNAPDLRMEDGSTYNAADDPRPDSAFYLEHYTPEERVILTVRPGITGWNQAINRNSVGTKEKLQADIYYVKHLNFWFDIKVLWLTFKTVLSHKDVYRA